MTREEAIDTLKNLVDMNVRYSGDKTFIEALRMAIEALSADAVHIETYRELYEKHVELKHASADRPQGEWIVTEHCSNAYGFRKWIEIECPFCGERPTYEDLDYMNYCPNCGAEMYVPVQEVKLTEEALEKMRRANDSIIQSNQQKMR